MKFENLEAFSIATQTCDVICSRAAFNFEVDASQTTRVSRFWSKCLFCVMSATNFLIFMKVHSCSDDQSNVLCFSVFFSSGRSTAVVCTG